LFGLVLLGFGIDPAFPPLIAVASALLLLVIIPVAVISRFVAHSGWNTKHKYALVCGAVIGSMAAGQLGFMDTTGPDLYFKIITNVIALILLIRLGMHLSKTWATT
jgi:Na+/H+ antiporter NhaC